MHQGKHITFIGLNFYPESTAIGLYSTQWVKFLEQQGYTVEVITAFPYYPEWKINAVYAKQAKWFTELYNTVKVHRYKQYVPQKPTFLKRILHILDFTFGSWKNLSKISRTDAVISVIPFTSSAWLGNKLSRKHNCPHWIHIQDFEFDAALQSGLAGGFIGKFLEQILQHLETSVLNKAKVVSTISHAMMDQLKIKTTTTPFYLPNWIQSEVINPEKASQHPYLKSQKFKILYSGNIGEKQDWAMFKNVVLRLDPEFYQVIVVGAGAQQNALKEFCDQQLHCQLFAPVPYNELNALLCSTDVHLLFQKPEVLDTVMPSKLLGMMASQKPSVITGHPLSEVKKVITTANAGYYVDEVNEDKIIKALTTLREDKVLSHKMGTCARKYVITAFEQKEVLNAFNFELNKQLQKKANS